MIQFAKLRRRFFMASISDSDLVTLINNLTTANAALNEANSDAYVKMGGEIPSDPGDSILVSTVSSTSSAAKQADLEEILEKISANLAWICDASNSILSSTNANIQAAASSALTEIDPPPEEVEPNK